MKEKQRTWLYNNLLPGVSLFFLGGCVLAWYFPLQAPIFYSTFFLLLLAAVYFYRKQALLCIPLIFLIFFLQGWNHTDHALRSTPKQGDIAQLISQKTEVRLTGTLISMPEFDGRKTKLIVEVDSVRLPDRKEFQTANGRIRLSLFDSQRSDFLPGTRLLAKATLEPVYNFQTPGVFNYKLYLASKKIHITGWVRSPGEIAPFFEQEHPENRWRYAPQQLRTKIGFFIDKNLSPKNAPLYRALLIGDRSSVDPTVLEGFKNSGTMHLLAISGLHMGLLGLMTGGLVLAFLKLFPALLLRFHAGSIAAIASIPVLFFYAVIAGLGTPAVRAFIMACIVCLALLGRYEYRLSHLISIAAFILVLFSPLSLFTVSFQLSFAAVIAIAFLLVKIGQKQKEMDDLTASHTGVQRLIRSGIRIAAFAILVSIVATIGTLPLLLYYFNRVSIIGPFMNLLIEPLLCFWALPFGLLAVPFMFTVPAVASQLLEIGSIGIAWTGNTINMASAIPFSSIWTITPSPAEIVGFYAAIILLILFGKNKQIFFAAGSILTCIALYFTAGLWLEKKATGSTDVTYIDVGQGSANLIQLHDGRHVMIDCGGAYSPRFDAGERIIAPMLWKKRIWRLDEIIITHQHRDHYGGGDFLIKHFHPEKIWINGMDGEDRYADLLRNAEKKKIIVKRAENGQTLFGETSTGLQCYGMPGRVSRDELRHFAVNDQSLVLQLKHQEISFLFPGDIEKKSEATFFNSGQTIKSTVLLAAHHGSITSNTPDFMSRCQPELVIVSASRSNSAIYPHPQRVQEWAKRGISTLSTATHGSITCSTSGDSLQVSSYKTNSQGNPYRALQLKLL